MGPKSRMSAACTRRVGWWTSATRCAHRGCTTKGHFSALAVPKRRSFSARAPRMNGWRPRQEMWMRPPRLLQVSYGLGRTKKAEFCHQHAKGRMMDVRNNKKCSHPGCSKRPSYGLDGTKKAEFCHQHAKRRMVGVHTKRCAHPGCTTRASDGTICIL